MRSFWHKRATAAFFRPKLQSVRASRRVAQSKSGTLPPRGMPGASPLPPPLTAPRHDSIPAAANPGAKTLGTVETDVLPCVVRVEVVCVGTLEVMVVLLVGLMVPALPTPPPMAVESERERDVAIPVPIPTPVAL